MLLPANTGLGDAAFVTERSAAAVVPTMVTAVALLLAEFGSLVAELAVTVSLIAVPLASPVFTFATIEKLAVVLPFIVRMVQTTLPVPPLPGVLQVQPAEATMETNVVFAGTASTSVALSAALGPLLATTWV